MSHASSTLAVPVPPLPPPVIKVTCYEQGCIVNWRLEGSCYYSEEMFYTIYREDTVVSPGIQGWQWWDGNNTLPRNTTNYRV